MGRGKNWSSGDDLNLCTSWIAASEDAIVGTGQKRESFWDGISKNFQRLTGTTDRSIASLQGRWSTINKDATKFNGIMRQVSNVPRSGWNEDKYQEEATKLFLEETGEEFLFLSCWMYLKDRPKWKISAGGSVVNTMLTKKDNAKKTGDKKEKATKETATTGGGDPEDIAVVSNERPLGNKIAKNARNVAERQVEIDERAVMVMESRAESQKDNLHF
jgi:hypothetical protein